ncbi:response regulator transcription factor [Enterovirga sp. CN4-39]|uniref:response regulator transcription factor n=1 Tax=Enterovirga sp. CN4-39 TaxID=3400910 RepID=UPI003C053C8C
MNTRSYVVAIVDDDPRLLESVGNLLESAGYEPVSFTSAATFLKAGLAGIDALITDIGMPGLDGFQLRDLVSRERPDMPVFLITGRHEFAEQGRAHGISGFFRKPFDGKALLAAVGSALNQQESGENR